ncbi:MAG: helix-turn-helix domain-containing protein [Bacteroidales bacterium]
MEKLRIKELLKLKGMTMIQLAERLGINRVNLSSSSINGNPTVAIVEKIAAVLGLSLAELFAYPIEENGVTGYLGHNGVIHKIESVSDVDSFVIMVKKSID